MAALLDGGAVYEKYSAMVFDIAQSYEADWDQQQDLAQNCWVTILENLESFNPDKSQLSTWVHTVAENVCRDYLRAQLADKRRLLVYEHEMGSTEIDWDPDYDDEYLDVKALMDLMEDEDGFEWLTAEEMVIDLERILSVTQKQCLVLNSEGYSSSEIGEELGISASAVRTHIERAREKVREYLEE